MAVDWNKPLETTECEKILFLWHMVDGTKLCIVNAGTTRERVVFFNEDGSLQTVTRQLHPLMPKRIKCDGHLKEDEEESIEI